MLSSPILFSFHYSPHRRRIINAALKLSPIQPILASPKSTLTLASTNNIPFRSLSSAMPMAKKRKTFYVTSNWDMRRLSISRDDSTVQAPTQQTNSFLLSLGYSHAVSQGIIDALIQNGIQPSSLLSMVKGLAGRYEVGEDAGLEALAASVKKELEKDQGKTKLKVWFLPSNGWSASEEDGFGLPTIHSLDRAFSVEVTENSNLADVVRFGTTENCDVLGEYLDCACNGIMACSTCHVVIHPEWFDSTVSSDEVSSRGVDPTKIGSPSDPEQDMIDLAFEPQRTSRLGCQITLTKALDGIVILLPSSSNNLMDHIPFE